MYLMKCGHVANAKLHPSGKPVCVICGGITQDAETIVRECAGTDGLESRKAKCSYRSPKRGYTCQGVVQSNWELPFFKHQPNQPFDEYYCGCWGWD